MKDHALSFALSLAVGFGMLATGSAVAATAYTWIGPGGLGGDGSWQTATNWDPEGVPGTDPADTATIPALASGGRTITNMSPVTIATLTINQTNDTAGVTNRLELSANFECGAFVVPNSRYHRVQMVVNTGNSFTYSGTGRAVRWHGGGDIVKRGSDQWYIQHDDIMPFTGQWIIKEGAFVGYQFSRLSNTTRLIVEPGAAYRVVDVHASGIKNFTFEGTGISGKGALEFLASGTVGVPVTLAGDTAVGVSNATHTGTIGGAIGGSGKLTKVGDGKLVLSSGANTLTGTIVVETGTLQLYSSVATAAGITVKSGATLLGSPLYVPKDGEDSLVEVEPGGTWDPGPNVWIGAGSGDWSEVANWSHGVVPGIGANVGQNVFIGDTTASRTITVDQPVQVGDLRWDQTSAFDNILGVSNNLTCATLSPSGLIDSRLRVIIASTATLSSGGNLTPTGGNWVDMPPLKFEGTGRIVKTGADTWGPYYGATLPFTGTWDVSNGVFRVDHWSRISNSGHIVINAGATMEARENATPFGDRWAYAHTFSGAGYTNSGALRLINASKTISIAQPVTLAADTVVHVDQANSLIILSGAIGGDGKLIKKGSGALRLSGTSTNDIEVAAGTLEISTADAVHPDCAIDVLTGGMINVNAGITAMIQTFRINGVEQLGGTWGKTGSGAKYEHAIFTGDGLLSVKGPPSGTLILMR